MSFCLTKFRIDILFGCKTKDDHHKLYTRKKRRYQCTPPHVEYFTQVFVCEFTSRHFSYCLVVLHSPQIDFSFFGTQFIKSFKLETFLTSEGMFAGVQGFSLERLFIKERLNAIMLQDYEHFWKGSFFVMLTIFLHLETSSFSDQHIDKGGAVI